MIDQNSEHQSDQHPAENTAADLGLVEAPWSVQSALGLAVVAFVLALLAGAVVARMGAAGGNPTLQALGAGGVFCGLYVALLGIVWISSATLGVRFVDAVGLRRAGDWRWYAAALGAATAGWLFTAAFTAALSALGVKIPRDDLTAFRLLPSGALGVAIAVLLLVVVAPIAEEVVYRGVLLSALSDRWGTVAGVAGSAVVFSAVHLSLVGFVPLLVMGALFGWLFVKSRSLPVAILAHATYNALGVIALLATRPGLL